MWRRHVGVAAKVTFAAYTAAEVTAFVGHQRRIARAELDRRKIGAAAKKSNV